MGKPRRPRGQRSTWEPKAPAARAPQPAQAAAAAPTRAQGAAAVLPPGALPLPEASAADAPTAEAAPTTRGANASAPASVTSIDPTAASGMPPAPMAPEQAIDGPARDGPARDAALAPTVEAGPDAPAMPAPLPPSAVSLDGAGPDAPFAPVRRAPQRVVFTPERLDLLDIGATIAGYVRGEGEAAAAHLRALTGVRSPADLIRVQVGEAQRAADASLTCWSAVARKAGRVFALR